MARIVLFFVFLSSFCLVYAQEPLDTLTLHKKPIKDAIYYRSQAKLDSNKALVLLDSAIYLRTNKQDANWVADVRVERALLFLKTGDSQRAFSELLTAEKIYTDTRNNSARANALFIMANFYEKNVEWDEAKKYYKKAQELQKPESDSLLALISLRLTNIALNQNDLKEANQQISYAIKHYQSINDKTGLGLSYVKLAEIYRLEKQYSKGEKLILKSALPFFRSTEYLSGRIGCFDVLGKIYQSQKKYSQSKWFFIQANTQARALDDVDGIITSLINLGKVKVAIGDYKLAKRDFNEAKALASDRDNLFLMANVNEAFALLYKKTGNYSGSEDARMISEKLRDSLNNYYNAEVELAKAAKIISEPVLTTKKGKPARTNTYSVGFILKVIGGALLFLLIIYLILRRLK